MDTGAFSDLIKKKVASVIQEHLKPIVNELAAQHRMLQTHSALLKYNHNINDYQMTRLENLRDLEQSINFKVAGALGFDPWQHPTMGTNLREPVPADPRLIPRFTPENTTSAQRATESAELIAQAGVSARRLGVPLTLHDFPRDPAIHCGGENEDPMHAAVPLYGIRAPRWRAKEGLPLDAKPGSATYNGVPAPPAGKKGRKLYMKKAQKLDPKWKTFEAATAPIGSSSTADVATSGGASTGGTPESPTVVMSTSSSSTTPTVPSSISTTTPPVPIPPSLKRTRRATGLDDDKDHNVDGSSHSSVAMVVRPMKTRPEPHVKQEKPGESCLEPEPQPQRKRRRRSAAPSPSPSIGLGVEAAGGPSPGPGQLRRSTRVARAHACATATTATVKPASRKRHTTGNGKRAATRSRS